mmetsp:Transcript_27531/g.84445  ORF Transcript_27531/g.84445 Transcript_27531/m.84445 type:complete len:104 (+) Transcript_27531:491-802(+)
MSGPTAFLFLLVLGFSALFLGPRFFLAFYFYVCCFCDSSLPLAVWPPDTDGFLHWLGLVTDFGVLFHFGVLPYRPLSLPRRLCFFSLATHRGFLLPPPTSSFG